MGLHASRNTLQHFAHFAPPRDCTIARLHPENEPMNGWMAWFLLFLLCFGTFQIRGKFVLKAGLPRRNKSQQDKHARFRLIHTNDVHSAVEKYQSLSAFIEDEKERALAEGLIPIYMDGGDFYSGSVTHVLGPRWQEVSNPEIEFLRRHDAIATLGNHEWDATNEGLATMLKKAQRSGLVGGIVATNISFDKLNPLSTAFFDGVLEFGVDGELKRDGPKMPMARAVIREYRSSTLSIFRIGFVGVMGPSAVGGCEVTRKGSGVSFHGYGSRFVARWVAKLRDLDVDVIVALCHGGSHKSGIVGQREDALFAERVPGVDIIGAGHTHHGYIASKCGHDSFAFQSGGHGQAVVSDFSFCWRTNEIREITLTDSTVVDHAAIARAWERKASYRAKSKVSAAEIGSWMGRFDGLRGLSHETPLIHLTAGSVAACELGDYTSFASREPLGRFVTSAVLEELNLCLGELGEKPASMFLTASALLRQSFPVGRATTFADVFAMVSRGVVSTGVAGELVPDGGAIAVIDMGKGGVYSLVSLLESYSRWFESEVVCAYSEGLEFCYRDGGIPLVNNLAGFSINGEPYAKLPRRLRIAMPSFIAQNLREKACGIVHRVIARQHLLYHERRLFSMDSLLASYLSRHSARVEQYGVTGTAPNRRSNLNVAHRQYHEQR